MQVLMCSLLVGGFILCVLGQCRTADDGPEKFDKRVVEIVERILKDKRTDKTDDHIIKLQRRVAVLERKVQVLEARDRRRGKLSARLLEELSNRSGYIKRVSLHQDSNTPIQEHAKNKTNQDTLNRDTSKKSTSGVFYGLKADRLGRLNSNGNTRVARSEHVHVYRRAPHQVAFSVYLDSGLQDVQTGVTVKCNRVFVNEGNFYNINTGVFSVPVDGVYLLTFHFVGMRSYTVLSIAVAGVSMVGGLVSTETNVDEFTGGNTVMMNLRAHQTVWLKVQVSQGGDLVSHKTAPFITFSGVLLY